MKYKPLEKNKVYKADCLVGLKRVPDKSVDLIFSDMPYGTTENDWDKPIDLVKYWKECKRVIKDNGAIILFAQSPYDKVLASSNLKMFRYEWIWEKELGTGFLNANKMPLKAHENILVFYKKLPTYNPIKTQGHKRVRKKASADKVITGSNYNRAYHRSDYDSTERYPRSVLKFTTDRRCTKQKEKHPTQKPLALAEYIIKTYSNKGDFIVDTCVGGGTIPLACIKNKRDFIGFEKYRRFINMYEKRLEILNTEECDI